jgi:hypothetical protein
LKRPRDLLGILDHIAARAALRQQRADRQALARQTDDLRIAIFGDQAAGRSASEVIAWLTWITTVPLAPLAE